MQSPKRVNRAMFSVNIKITVPMVWFGIPYQKYTAMHAIIIILGSYITLFLLLAQSTLHLALPQQGMLALVTLPIAAMQGAEASLPLPNYRAKYMKQEEKICKWEFYGSQKQFYPHQKVLIFGMCKKKILMCSQIKVWPDEPHRF